jgi:ubiquinone biosynthesis protein
MTRRELDAALATAFPTGLPFASFDRRALAVGSIAEVHRATLGDGESVIVKLVRPGLVRAIERDVNAATAALHVVLALPGVASKATRVALFRALEELGAALRAEADLRREARALEDFGRRLRSSRRVRVPRVHRHWSGETALVMEELVGEPLSAYRARAAADPEAARRVADLAFREILKQVFEDGRFHADPHAGNLLVLPDGRLGLIDLGLTGEATAEDRTRIARAVRAFVSGDPEALVRALLGFGVPPPGFDFDAFKADVLVIVRRNESHIVAQLTGRDGAASASSRLETFVHELFRVAEDHDLYVPPSSTLLVKTIVTIEGVARSLDPQLNVVAAAVPIVLRALGRRWLRWDFWREWSLAS